MTLFGHRRSAGLGLLSTGVVCPCHEYCFELGTGRNVTIPRLCSDQHAFPVRVENGRVLLELEE